MKKSNTRRHFLSLVIGSVSSLFLPAWSFAKRYWPVRTVEKNMPVIDKSNWCFKIDGLVENELSFNLEQLKNLPSIIQTTDLDCVERWSVRKLKWQGVPMKTLIDLTKPKPDAKFLTFHCAGGIYSESLTLEQAMNDDVILAYAVDGRPLEPKHGAPLRLVVPGFWGYKSAKWVERIEFVAERHRGYWEQRGYDPNAGPKNSSK